MVEYRTRNRKVAGSTHARSTASNLEQVANLLCAQANSASYPKRDGKRVVAMATGWRPSVADCDDVCLLAAPWVQLAVGAGNGWPHNALRHHWFMTISCRFRDCNALLVTSLTHVSGSIISVHMFSLTFKPTVICDNYLYVVIPETEHRTSDWGFCVVETIIANCSPNTGDFDLQTTFIRHPTPNKSYICNSKFLKLITVCHPPSKYVNKRVVDNDSSDYVTILLFLRNTSQ